MWLKKRTSSMQFDLNTVQTLYFKHMEGMKKKKQSTQKNYFYMKTKFSFCNWKDWVQSAN